MKLYRACLDGRENNQEQQHLFVGLGVASSSVVFEFVFVTDTIILGELHGLVDIWAGSLDCAESFRVLEILPTSSERSPAL